MGDHSRRGHPRSRWKASAVDDGDLQRLLTALRVLDPIDAWSPSYNVFSRLGQAPKHHLVDPARRSGSSIRLVDPALAARLLGRTRAHLLAGSEPDVVVRRDGPLLGNLFESLVALSVRTHAQELGASVFHLHNEAGRREIDFIVEYGDGVLAVEAKLSGAIADDDVRHLVALRKEIGDR